MASKTLYPPIINNYQPAFIATDGKCRVYFSLSKFFNGFSNIKNIHISVAKKQSGVSVVNKMYLGADAACNTGIIITTDTSIIQSDTENGYYIDIPEKFIRGGWVSGQVYKIQLRFSEAEWKYGDTAKWLNENANQFSEWSTYTLVKATSKPTIVIPSIGYDSGDKSFTSSNSNKILNINSSTLELLGFYSNEDESEKLYSYTIKLFNTINTGEVEDSENDDTSVEDTTPSEDNYTSMIVDEDAPIESSSVLYQDRIDQNNQLYYLFQTELEEGRIYSVRIEFETINRYTDAVEFQMETSGMRLSATDVSLISIGNNSFEQDYNINHYTTLEEEEEEGCIALKIYCPNSEVMFTNFCIRRADSKDNFKKWTDMKMITCAGISPNDIDIYRDYTVESGVYYKYGIEEVQTNGDRGILNDSFTPIKRDFEYSFLLGKDGKQLKLKFDNVINSFSHNVIDSKNDTLGSKYPFITRNGRVNYKTFPLSGLISFHMDEQANFISREEIYKYFTEVISMNNADAENTYAKEMRRLDGHNGTIPIVPKYNVGQKKYDYDGNFYDVTYERLFREKVLEFLYDGEPKLFKSPTEGNIIVRLMDISCSPNQTLNRLIYSFDAMAHEVADAASMQTLAKYGFYEVGEWSTDFSTVTTKLGQLIVNLNIRPGQEQDIIDLIYKKYDSQDKNIAGRSIRVANIRYLTIEFEDKPMKVGHVFAENGDIIEHTIGYKMNFNSNNIIVHTLYPNIYAFDPSVILKPFRDSIIIYGDVDGHEKTLAVTVNFLYDEKVSKYEGKKVKSRTASRTVGQVFSSYSPLEGSIYKDIYNKYYYSSETDFRYISQITWTCLEANPGTVFYIYDSKDVRNKDASYYQHDIGYTGILNLEDLGSISDLQYVGVRDPETGEIKTTRWTTKWDEKKQQEVPVEVPITADIKVDYLVYLISGEYVVNNTRQRASE